MKIYVKLLSLAAVVVSLVASCVNEGLQEPQDASVLKMIPSLEAQAAAVEASVEDLQNLQDALNAHDVLMDKTMADAFEQHAADISKGGATLEEGTLASFKLQMKLGTAVGSVIAELDAETYETELKSSFDKLETGVCKWVGESFGAIYPVAVAEARVKASVAKFDAQLAGHKLYVDALQSDIQAGLKTDGNPEELTSLAADVHETAANSEKLVSDLVALSAEVEKEYEAAVKSVLADPAGFDGESLKGFNANAGIELAGVDNTLEGLASRVALCESKLADILERLGALETEIGDLEELLGMVQSVTFLSEFSEDKAVAYYTMNVNGTPDSEGRKPRTPDGTLSLKYVVRPASAAAALTTSSLWNNDLKVFGYYAEQMTKAAGDFFDFTITNVTADKTTGVATITVKNSLSSGFFFKETGAKLALSLTTGATDLTSKFVEVVPKDASNTVYIETLTLSSTNMEIDNGQSKKITATVTPSDVTTDGVVWTSSNTSVLTVGSDGTITAKSVGEAVVTATSNSVNEWGNKLEAKCTVKVNPSIRLSGPAYVEQGGEIEIKVESPDYINPDLITWEIDGGATTQAYASVTKAASGAGVVYGKGMWFDTTEKSYKPITVNCTIDGATPVELTHEIRVIAKQPQGIAIDGLAYDQNRITIKKGATYTFNSTLEPAGVSSEYFRIRYQSAQNWIASVDYESGLVRGLDFGTAYIDVKVLDSGTYNYFYPSRNEMVRQIAVNVEPYWITAMTLPEMDPIAPESTGTFVPEFTSDVPGTPPTNQTLTWKSSNTSVITVDETTGAYKAVGVGTATITATTTGEWTTKGDPISATCDVRVEKLENLPTVGDYYYADGTYSSTYSGTDSNPAIGVVFAIVDATKTDAMLDAKLGEATALVVGLEEYSSVWGDFATGYNYQAQYFINNGYDNGNTAATNGYSNTLGLDAYRTDNRSGASGVEDVAFGIDAPATSSGWYIPSYYELYLLSQSLTTVNSSINGRGTQVSSGEYLTSSLIYEDYKNAPCDISKIYLFNMSQGTWGTSFNSNYTNTPYPVRVVLAF